MQIPGHVQKLFCEYDTSHGTEGPEWERAAIEKVMLRGKLDDMRWLLRAFPRDRLRAYLETRGRRVLPPREVSYWALICGVSEEHAAAWIDEARQRERVWRG